MDFVQVMWGVWGAILLVTAVVYLYRSRLSRDEEDQIFLDDSFSHEKAAQAEIVAKVNKVEPILKALKLLFLLATAVVVGYYIWDVITQFK